MAVTQASTTGAAPRADAAAAPAADTPRPTPSFAAGEQVESAPGRLGFIGILNRFSSGAGVTPEIEAYLKTVTTQVRTNIPRLEVTQLAEPLAAHAFSVVGSDNQRYAYIIIFTDAIGTRPPNNIPMSRYIRQAHSALVAQFPNCHMVAATLIGNQDLGRARMMGNSIQGGLLPQIDSEIANTGASVLSAAGLFSIDLNLEAARNFENAHSPHDVRPAADIGFTVALDQPRNRQLTGGGYGQDIADTQKPFMALTAKVEINGPQRDVATGAMRYVPIVRITSITSDLPLIGSALLALVIAADYFITKRFWQRAFSRFDRGAPNLGNLFPNPNQDSKKANELYAVTNQLELDQLVHQQFTAPMLVLDVQEGHDRLTNLAAFVDQDRGRQTLLRAATTFFGSEPPPSLNIGATVATTFEGYYGDQSGRLIDTRSITYLDQVARQGVLDHNVTQALLNYDMNPMRRADVIAALTQNFVSAFETFLVAIDGQFMAWVAQAVQRTGMKIADPSGTSGFVQMPASFMSATNYANFTGVATAQGGYYAPPPKLYG